MIKIMIVILLSGGVIFFGAARPVARARSGAAALFRPLMSGATGAGRWFGRQFGPEEVRRLTEENERLTVESFGREKLAQDIKTLESALAFRDAAHLPMIAGRVLSYANELGREVLVIDQGASAGAAKGDVVIDAHAALVGEVDEAGDNSSRVLIASNPAVTFPAFLLSGGPSADARAGGSILARGLGARAFSIELIPRSIPIKRGDFMVRRLAGFGGRERDIPAASVIGEAPDSAGGFARARAVLITRPETLEYVFIIPAPRK